MPNFSEHN